MSSFDISSLGSAAYQPYNPSDFMGSGTSQSSLMSVLGTLLQAIQSGSSQANPSSNNSDLSNLLSNITSTPGQSNWNTGNQLLQGLQNDPTALTQLAQQLQANPAQADQLLGSMPPHQRKKMMEMLEQQDPQAAQQILQNLQTSDPTLASQIQNSLTAAPAGSVNSPGGYEAFRGLSGDSIGFGA